jgi:phosphate-selective porin OprO/OprP
VSAPGTDDGWDVSLRRLRIETLGRISYGLDTRYKISFGAEDRKIYLNDFWLAWNPGKWVDRIRLGYIDPPFSLEALTSNQERSFMESAAPVLAFAPGSRLGLETRDRFLDPDVSWIASVSSLGQSQQFSDASDSPFRFSLRTVWRPGGAPTDESQSLTHLGIALGYSLSGKGDTQFRARPESTLSDFLVDTGQIGDSSYTQLGLEFARRQGPLTIQAEWIGSRVQSSESGSHFFDGGYLEVAWTITGEVRPYDARSGLFTPMQPRAPFSWERRTFGGLEFATRLSRVDLTDGSVRGGRMTTVNASTIWSLSRFARIHLDGIYANVQDRQGLGGSFIMQMRIELTM